MNKLKKPNLKLKLMVCNRWELPVCVIVHYIQYVTSILLNV
jgi:hypothetical protein